MVLCTVLSLLTKSFTKAISFSACDLTIASTRGVFKFGRGVFQISREGQKLRCIKKMSAFVVQNSLWEELSYS